MRTVPCGLSIRSDPRLLEQMIRNLLSNALKYTNRGKVLLGCRRRGGILSIEVWDTGIGIPDEELKAIFEEYHQVDNAARERSRGLGLGLSIVATPGEIAGPSDASALAPARARSSPSKSRCADEAERSSNASARHGSRDRRRPSPHAARFWSSRTIPKCANCSSFSSRTRAIE